MKNKPLLNNGAKSPHPSVPSNPTIPISHLGAWAIRSKTSDDAPGPLIERLWKFQDRTQSGMTSPSVLQFEARTRLDSEQAVETLYFNPERQCFLLKRSDVRSDGDWGESYGELTAPEAVLWSIDRLLGPRTFAAMKQFTKPIIAERKRIADALAKQAGK